MGLSMGLKMHMAGWYCGCPGEHKRYTFDPDEVTCKNCLRELARRVEVALDSLTIDLQTVDVLLGWSR